MRLTYQTAVATLAQFLSMTILGVPNALVSIITTCHSNSTNCVSNTIVSILYFLLTALWFGVILVIGYNAQHRRSRKLAFVLIGFEFAVFAVAAFINLPHDSNYLTKATSLIDALLSIWVIYLALHILRAGDKRIVAPARKRQRKIK